MLCCICAREGEKKGKVALCKRHIESYVWDGKRGYLRKVKRGGKWDGTWPSQATVARLLEQMGYEVDQEVRPLWAVSSKGVLLPYDIALPDERILVEYQGEQHFYQERFFFKDTAKWKAYIARQELKKRLARINGWRLVEITYKDKPLTHAKVKAKVEGVCEHRPV